MPVVPQRVLTWYGDDFTGSTDALEALASAGVEAVLFLERPDDSFLSRFDNCRALGLAGSSRSQSPEWMDANLPAVFEWLRSLGARLCHYKVCSTFDSSPHIGSIGRALEIGKYVFQSDWVPVVAGAPSLRRYVVFGQLFAAAADGRIHRIDRHPTMSCHPVTPMDEADLRLHLSLQTDLRSELLDIRDLNSGEAGARLQERLAGRPGIVVIDTLNDQSLLEVGRLLWSDTSRQPFVVGSSGVEYALTAWWGVSGAGVHACGGSRESSPQNRLLVLSGSCSPVTQRQILHAGRNGFTMIRLDVNALVSGDGRERAVNAAVREATAALGEGRSVVLYTAAGPNDKVDGDIAFRNCLGEQSGRILRTVLDRSGVRRVVVAGGDTSSHAGRHLSVEALTYVAGIAPGAPLCRAWSRDPDRNGIEVVFKGGQCGRENFFSLALNGKEQPR